MTRCRDPRDETIEELRRDLRKALALALWYAMQARLLEAGAIQRVEDLPPGWPEEPAREGEERG